MMSKIRNKLPTNTNDKIPKYPAFFADGRTSSAHDNFRLVDDRFVTFNDNADIRSLKMSSTLLLVSLQTHVHAFSIFSKVVEGSSEVVETATNMSVNLDFQYSNNIKIG